ncbi:MAG: DUF3825 domain-containing protein [Oscillospiraceae bacterium]|nr:DUF3825 domain-containing protein [Oscillospiraceae bacterium]
MLTHDQKVTIYSCIKSQFPDPGLYRTSRVAEWLETNGYTMERLGYTSFRDFAKDFTEMFTFQDDDNDVFIKTNNWEPGEGAVSVQSDIHPADGFFGTNNIVLNDDIIEMSQQSLYALTKILGNNLTVQAMKQQIYLSFNEAKESGRLQFFADKYTFPIDYCADGYLVNGNITKNISPLGRSLYFSFEKTRIFRGDSAPELKRHQPAAPEVSREAKEKIYRLLVQHFPLNMPIHMATVSKLLTDHGVDRARYGFNKMKELLAELDFLELEDVVLGGVPQIKVTIRSAPSLGAVMPQARKERDCGAPFNSDVPFVPAEKPAYRSDDRRDIPEGALDGFCNLPVKPLEIIRSYLMHRNEETDIDGIRRALAEDFETAREVGKIRHYDNKIIFPCRYLKEDGSAVEITLKPSAYEGKRWFLYYVDTAVRDRGSVHISPGKQLENFAFLGSWSSFLAELADKAVTEEWDFRDSHRKSYHILIQYIKYTFARLKHENKVCISVDKQFAAFNTGLVDKHYDDIYACFGPNDPKSDTRWKFTGFCTAASRGLGKMLVNYFNPLPLPPRYFTKSEDLFFDLDKRLHTDFDHIIIDNIRRLPLHFLEDQFSDCPEAKEICAEISGTTDKYRRTALYNELKEIISDNSRLFIRIQNRIKDSIELARKRVRWNYKTAIPSYFPKRDSMSLMLPLCLTEEETPDVALVVELTQSGNYQGQTILTIPQAYIDARLMCRITGDWLNPSQISFGTEDPEEQDLAAANEEMADNF